MPSFFRQDGGQYGRFQWQIVADYLIGFAVEIPFINTTFYEGPVAKALNGTDLSWLVGLAVTVPLYYFSAVRRGLTKPSPPPIPGGHRLGLTAARTSAAWPDAPALASPKDETELVRGADDTGLGPA